MWHVKFPLPEGCLCGSGAVGECSNFYKGLYFWIGELPLRTDGKRECDNTSSDHHRDALHDARLCPDTTRLDACSTCSVELHGL